MSWNVRDWFREDIRHDDPETAAVWRAWFARHGVDPAPVLLDQWVERVSNTIEHKIVWLEAGVRDGEPITVHREQSFEAPPEAFPEP